MKIREDGYCKDAQKYVDVMVHHECTRTNPHMNWECVKCSSFMPRADRKEMANAINEYEKRVGDTIGLVSVSGDTYPIKDILKGHGYKWENREWAKEYKGGLLFEYAKVEKYLRAGKITFNILHREDTREIYEAGKLIKKIPTMLTF